MTFIKDDEFKNFLSQIKVYCVSGDTFRHKEEIKAWAGFWDAESKVWIIENPDELCLKALSKLGLKLDLLDGK